MSKPRSGLLIVAAAPEVALAVAALSQHQAGGIERGLLGLAPGCVLAALALAAACWRGTGSAPALAAALLATGLALAAIVVVPLPPDVAVALYLGLVLAGAWFGLTRLKRTRRAAAVGVGLLGLVLGGWSLLPPPDSPAPSGEPLTNPEDPVLLRRSDESPRAFAMRLNDTINTRLTFRPPRVQARESWLIWLAAHAPWAVNLDDLQSPDLIVRRGGGYCHQSSLVFVHHARLAGLEARTLGLNGHVVALVKLDGRDVWFDPDVGVAGFPYAASKKEVHAAYLRRLEPLAEPEVARQKADHYAGLAARRDRHEDAPYRDSSPFLGGAQERLFVWQLLFGLGLLALGVGASIRVTPASETT